jgi:hypothetical protein
MMTLSLTAREEGHAPSKITHEGSGAGPFLMNPLIRKLSNYIDLPEADQRTLEGLSQTPKHFAAHTDLIREDATPDSAYLILSGWACRYKALPDGGRQIRWSRRTTQVQKVGSTIWGILPGSAVLGMSSQSAVMGKSVEQIIERDLWTIGEVL